jgi:pseudo-rSAM protein
MERIDYKKNKGDDQSYWLSLYPYVYVSVKKDRAILYNTLNHNLLEYESDCSIFKLIKRLDSPSNLYVIKIKAGEIDGETGEFIDRLRSLYFGDVIDTTLSSRKPVQFKPILNLQKTLDSLTLDDGKSMVMVHDEIPDYLNIVTLYVNSDCNQSCTICRDGYKQFLCCHKSDRNGKHLSLENISTLIDQIKTSSLHKLNITGGNLFSYSMLNELVKYLNQTGVLKEYYFHYLNIEDHPTFFKLLQAGNNQLSVTVHFPIELDVFERKMELVLRSQIDRKWSFQFVIQSEKDIKSAKTLISKFQMDNNRIIPYYNGHNLDFFRQNVFLNRESILTSQPGMNDLHVRAVLNTSDFKKLTVLSDKSIYANLNNPKIGTLGKDHVMKVLYNELHTGKSWTKVRKHVKPCMSCVFNALCPPISNYEYAIDRYNLCDIK